MHITKAERTDLMVLGLLQRHPFYGYRLKTMLSTILAPLGAVGASTLYYNLARLTKSGLVEPDQPVQGGAHPPRTQYSITDAGREHLSELLDKALHDLACPVCLPLLVLALQDAPATEVERRLNYRIGRLLEQEAFLRRRQAEDVNESGGTLDLCIELACSAARSEATCLASLLNHASQDGLQLANGNPHWEALLGSGWPDMDAAH